MEKRIAPSICPGVPVLVGRRSFAWSSPEGRFQRFMSAAVEVRRAQPADEQEIFDCAAALHLDLIHGGILPLLGKAFLSDLYREIAGAEAGFVGFAMRGTTVIGFIA